MFRQLRFLCFLGVCAALSGCGSLQRTAVNATTAAAGAGLGYAVNKSPGAAAIGAAGGLIVGEVLNYGTDRQKAAAFSDGYDKGRSDEIKTLYWAQRSLHAAAEDTVRRKYVEVPVEEHRARDGTIIEPSTRVIEVVE